MRRLHRFLHGWEVFFHCYNLGRFKAHGAKGQTMKNSILMAQCARWVAVQQHRPDLNPILRMKKDA
jgi:hypothetical protein